MESSVNFPPKELFSSNNFEFIILWMLKHNEFCSWGDFNRSSEIYKGISNATLSKYLKELIINDFIIKEKRNIYKITKQGEKKYKDLELGLKKKLDFPPKEILELKNDLINVLYMIINNLNCSWGDFPTEVNKYNALKKFGNPPPIINQKKLSEILKRFEKQEYIEKREGKKPIYIITGDGYNAYIEKLRENHLDRESLLMEWAESIQSKKELILRFLEKMQVNEKDLAFRVMDNYLYIPIKKVDLKITPETFLKIILYISWNHPDNYGNFISIKQFSEQFDIDKLTLEYNLREIVEKKDPRVFFALKHKYKNEIYYFRENENLEKNIRAIIEESLKKKIYFDLNPYSTDFQIIEEICDIKKLVKSDLKYALRVFVKEYIQFLEQKTFSTKFTGLTREIQDIKTQMLGLKKIKEEKIYETTKNINAIKYGSLMISKHDASPQHSPDKVQNKEKLEAIDKELDRNPNDVNLYIRKSRVLCDYLFQFEEALQVVEQGLIIDKYEISLYINKAMIFSHLNRLDDAVKVIEDAYILEPENDVLLSKMSYIYYEKRELDKALKLIKKALKLNPNNLLYFSLKAEIEIDLGKYTKALESLDYALAINPNDVYSFQLITRIYIFLEVYDGALDFINKAVNLDPEDSFSYQIKAEILELQGNTKMALSIIDDAIVLNPADPYSYQIEARIIGNSGNLNQALKIIKIAIDLDPDDYYSFQIKAEFLRRMGDFTQAAEEIEKSLLINPNDVESLEIKALIHLNNSNLEIALNAINKAINLGADDFPYYQIKAYILKNLEKYDEAIENLNKSIEIEPESPYNYQIKAQIKFELDENEDALELIEKAIDYGSNLIDQQKAISYQIKANILSELGYHGEALEASNKAIRFDPKKLLNYNNKVFFLEKLGKKKEAIQLIKRLVRMAPNEAFFYDTYGKILMNSKDFESAIDKFQIALDEIKNKSSELPDIREETFIKLGICFFELNNCNKAKNYLDKGLRLAEDRRNKLWIEKSLNYLSKLEKI